MSHTSHHTRMMVVLLLVQRVLLGFATALLLFVFSPYVQAVSGGVDSGVFFLLIAAAVVAVLLFLHKVVAAVGRARLFLALLFALSVLAVVLARGALSAAGLALALVYMVLATVAPVVLDMIIESFSSDAQDGRMRGAMLGVWNLGFLIGPAVAGALVDAVTIRGVFALLAAVYGALFVLVFVALRRLRRLNHIARDDPRTMVRHAWRRRWFRHVYTLAVVLQFFYAVMVVYMPLYLLALGFSAAQTGVLFTLMLVPFVLVKYPAGILADTVLGEREMTLAGLGIMLATMGVIAFAPLATFAAWALVLFLSRVGAALLESMTDIFFYKHVADTDVGLIDLYRTASGTGFIIATAVAVPLLLLVHDVRATFVLTIGAVLYGMWHAWRMHDTTVTS